MLDTFGRARKKNLKLRIFREFPRENQLESTKRPRVAHSPQIFKMRTQTRLKVSAHTFSTRRCARFLAQRSCGVCLRG